jgi:hypothetical protein
MNTKKVMSIVVLITAATIFALSSVVVTPAIAQTFGGGADGGAAGSSSTGSSSTGSSSTGSSSTGSSSENYKEFQKCLSGAETGGSATEQQIRDCFAPIYNTDGGSDDDSDDSSSGSSSSGSSSSDDDSDDSSSGSSSDDSSKSG